MRILRTSIVLALIALPAAHAAEKLGMDPVEFRIINDTQVDPEHPERPFSKRQLVECLRVGADRFGWQKRRALSGSRLSGRSRTGGSFLLTSAIPA